MLVEASHLKIIVEIMLLVSHAINLNRINWPESHSVHGVRVSHPIGYDVRRHPIGQGVGRLPIWQSLD